MRKLALVVLAIFFASFIPAYSQQEDFSAAIHHPGFLKAIGFGFQGQTCKSLDLKLWNPTFGHNPEPSENETSVETSVVTTNASSTANASSTMPIVPFRKSELQTKYDQRLGNMRQPGQSSSDADGSGKKSDLQKQYDQRLHGNRQTSTTATGAPRKSERQLQYDQRLRQGNRVVPGGADQPPIIISKDSDGSIKVNGVEFKLKFVFYQPDFSTISADVFSANNPQTPDENRSTSSLRIPLGNLRLDKAEDYKASRAYIGSLSLNDEETGISGIFKVWLNDLAAR